MTKALLVVGLLAGALPGVAQRRASAPLDVWTEAQLELARKSGDYWWLSLRDQRSTDGSYNADVAFKYNWLQLGYEHFLNPNWSVGGNARLTFYQYAPTDVVRLKSNFAPEALLRHQGNLGGFTFGQRLGLLYQFGNDGGRNEGQASLRFDLYRNYPVGKLTLRPRLSAEAATVLRLQPPDNQPDERTIDRTRLRAELGLKLSDHFDLTPYFTRQVGYVIAQPQYDQNGNVSIPGGRLNLIQPVVGLDLRYTLFQGKEPFERTQLPTQH